MGNVGSPSMKEGLIPLEEEGHCSVPLITNHMSSVTPFPIYLSKLNLQNGQTTSSAE